MVEPWPTGSWRVESRTALQERAGLSPYRHLTDEEKVEMRGKSGTFRDSVADIVSDNILSYLIV
jgi:hypothetical protein